MRSFILDMTERLEIGLLLQSLSLSKVDFLRSGVKKNCFSME